MGVSATSVTLFIPGNPKLQKIPLSTLSATDQAYLKAHRTGTLKTSKKRTSTPKRTTTKALVPPSTKAGVLPSKSTSYPTSEALKKKYRLADNYSNSWPNSTSVPVGVNIRVVSENKEKGQYIYQSPNYEFICDVKLSKTIIQKFALLFEATRELCKKIPISNIRARVPGSKQRNRILLFGTDTSYIKNGGAPETAGVYNSRTNLVLIPLSSLGVKYISGTYNYDYTKSNDTITHELVHQVTDLEYYQHGAEGWFSEGIAEYCGATPYKSGQFSLRRHQDNIKTYLLGEKPWTTKASISIGSLKNYMLQSYGSFVSNAQTNYRMGLILTYYFIHMESDRKNLTAFLKALKTGKTGEKAIASLLNGRTYEELEQDIQKAWGAAGIIINFK